MLFLLRYNLFTHTGSVNVELFIRCRIMGSDSPIALPSFAASPYASFSALGGRTWAASTDLTPNSILDAEFLAKTVRERAFRNELILFTFDFCALSEALSLILMLRRAGFEHFAPLTDGAETCETLRQAAIARQVSPLWPCWYSSLPNHHKGWERWGSKPGCVSAARSSHYCVIEQLWAARYYVCGKILSAGVNLLHVDTDAAFLSDPYELLKTPPLSAHSLIVLPESPVNGGMWYAQNTQEGAGAQWVISEVAKRTFDIISLPVKRKYLPPFDQAVFGDVLWTAADNGTRHWAAACTHPIVGASALCRSTAVGRPKHMKWPTPLRTVPPSAALSAMLLPWGFCKRNEKDCKAPRRVRADAARTPTTKQMLRAAELRVPGVARVESAITGPPWLFPNAWKAQLRGVFGRRPAGFAVGHLLGVRCRWCLSSDDVDHGAKWEWQHLSGFWPGGAYTVAPPLGSTENSSLSYRVEHNCRKKGRSRVLYADRPALVLAPDSPALRRAEAADDDGEEARALVRRLILLATLTGRMAVLPSFNCTARWIQKEPAADLHEHVTDLRVVVVDVAAGRPLHEQRCAPCNVQFACREHVLSEAQFREAHALHGKPTIEALQVPLTSAGARPVVDLPKLWRRLLKAPPASARRLDDAAVLSVDELADIEGNACTIDGVLIQQARPIAARAVQIHCGVEATFRNLRSACPRAPAEVDEELTKWDAAVAATRSGGGCSSEGAPWPLAERLGFRCADMMCSTQSCKALAVEMCIQRLVKASTSSAGGTRAGRDVFEDRCQVWVNTLPTFLGARCDVFSGRCRTPPEAHPAQVSWPAVACLSAERRNFCEDPRTGKCGPCWSSTRRRARSRGIA